MYPAVPEGPLTVKDISFEVELNARDDRVELDSAKNRLSLAWRLTLMFFTSWVPECISLPFHSAFKMNFPVAVGIQLAE